VAHTYRHPSDARQRTQAKFWLLAIGVSGPFDLTNLLPLYGINVYPLGSFGNVVYLGIVAYAIARHRLMDVDYVVRKAVSFSLAAILDVETCEIFLPDENGRRLALAYPSPGVPEPLAEAIARDLEQLAEPVLASEVETLSPVGASLFRTRRWEVGIPLRVNDR